MDREARNAYRRKYYAEHKELYAKWQRKYWGVRRAWTVFSRMENGFPVKPCYRAEDQAIIKNTHWRGRPQRADPHKLGYLSYRARDTDEVRAYIAINPAATIYDVAMCCHMCNNQAERLLKKARQEASA